VKPNIHPPRLARAFFKWYCGAAQVEDLVGDMDEMFRRNLSRMPAWRAKAKYWRQILSLISSYAIRKRRQRASLHPYSSYSINFHMIKNYFLIAWRMMTRNKVYTVINVLGLTLGISACIIVFLVASYELSFDNFHPDAKRIYRLHTLDSVNGWDADCIPAPAFVALHDDYAGAEALTGYHTYGAKAMVVVDGEEKHFTRTTVNAIIASPDYFRIFQYRWLAGNMDAFAKPMQVVLTESRARTYFGSLELQEILGKNITYDDSLTVSVAGVVKDWSANSDLKRSEFISFSTIENSFLRKVVNIDNWGMMVHSSQSFIKIKSSDKPEDVEAQLSKIMIKHDHKEYSFKLEPLSNLHFPKADEATADIKGNLYMLSGLAAFILIIAAINFINLSTAQSIRRAREIGVRKVMGSLKRQIILQFLSETLVLAFISLCVSIALIRPLLWLFSDFVPQGVTFDPLTIDTWLFLGGLMLMISLLAGLYPSLVMSSYRPAIILSGKKMSAGRGAFSLRKSLIVLQFSASLFFIIATLVIGSQMDLIRKEDRGFSTSGVITFWTDWRSQVSKAQTLVERLRDVPGIDDVSQQGSSPMGFAQWKFDMQFNGKKIVPSIKSGDAHYIPVYKLRLVAGRNITPADSANRIVINQTFSKELGFDDPNDAIGQQIKKDPNLLTIVGVVHDFHIESFRNAIGPAVIGNFKQMQNAVAIRLQNADILANTAVIERIQSEYNRIYPGESFDYHFIEDEIGWMHGEEQKTSKLATIAMGVTIFISCMGVFGLAMFTAAMRTREIGIRKVLGATAVNIVNMLSREFMILIIVSIVIATPIAWYYMNNWLLGFTYRTELSWWFFVAAAAIALLTGLVTVSFQSFKAAISDPVKALRTE
jgi:putative ABC transport system permease protein